MGVFWSLVVPTKTGRFHDENRVAWAVDKELVSLGLCEWWSMYRITQVRYDGVPTEYRWRWDKACRLGDFFSEASEFLLTSQEGSAQ